MIYLFLSILSSFVSSFNINILDTFTSEAKLHRMLHPVFKEI